MHQDAHEFLNHLLNMIVEEVEKERKSAQGNSLGEDCEFAPLPCTYLVLIRSTVVSSSVATLGSPPTIVTATTSSNSASLPQEPTLVHKLFEGVLTSETRCLTCETVSITFILS
jgi:ubiquitin carboxyl-terminal hydrolase 9/13